MKNLILMKKRRRLPRLLILVNPVLLRHLATSPCHITLSRPGDPGDEVHVSLLNPRMKLEYFEQKWPRKWVEDARHKIQHFYN